MVTGLCILASEVKHVGQANSSAAIRCQALSASSELMQCIPAVLLLWHCKANVVQCLAGAVCNTVASGFGMAASAYRSYNSSVLHQPSSQQAIH